MRWCRVFSFTLKDGRHAAIAFYVEAVTEDEANQKFNGLKLRAETLFKWSGSFPELAF